MDKETLRGNAESVIRARIRRSKVIGRSLAAVSVAAGIVLGVSSSGKEAPATISGLTELGVMAGGLATATSTQRKCRHTVENYRRVIEMSEPPEREEADTAQHRNAALRIGHFAFHQFNKLVYPVNGAMQPMVTWYGTSQVADYMAHGGSVLPTGLANLANGSQGYDVGLAFGTVMAVQGSLMLSTGVTASEQYYARQLDEIDGLGLAGQPAAA